MKNTSRKRKKRIHDLETELERSKEMEKTLKAQLEGSANAQGLEHENSQLKSKLAEAEADLNLQKEKVKKVDKLTKLNKDLQTNNTQLVRLGKTLRKKAKAFERDAEDAWKSLELERELSKRLEGLISNSNVGINGVANYASTKKQEETIQELNLKVEELTADLNSKQEEFDAALKSKSETGEQELRHEVKELEADLSKCTEKTTALSVEVEEKDSIAKELGELKSRFDAVNEEFEETQISLRELQEGKQELKSKVAKAVEDAKKCEENCKEMESLFSVYQKKLEDPALADYLEKKFEWLQNPQVEGVTIAYDKTVKMIGPRLNVTKEKLEQVKKLLEVSSQTLSNAVGKPEYTPLVSGLLTYGILLLPFCFSVCILVRVKRAITLRKTTVWMSLYLCLFSLGALALSKVVKLEPMLALRQHNESAYEFLQLGVAAFGGLYYFCVYLYTFAQITFEGKCTFSFRHVFQLVLPAAVATHYYYHVWLLAMKDKDPDIEVKHWAGYAGIFFFLFLLFTFFTKSNTRIDKKEQENVLPVSQPLNQPLLNQSPTEDMDDVKNDEHSNGVGNSKEKKSKKSKKKKHKHGHKVAEALDNDATLMEFEAIEPEHLMEEVETIAEAATTGESIHDIKKRKAEKKRKKKAKNKLAESYSEDDDDLETQKKG
uniref:Uncharacterized protein n=1 Tax=Aplanochytrium stocchinoi TaxID=215587 RepID=A0A7S3PL48_9STRA